MDDDLREKTEEVLDGLGLSISAAVNIYARQIVRAQGIPFPLTLVDAPRADRTKAAKAFAEYAKAHPAGFGQSYRFNRDECYDDE
jgi:addiction module RelB/DinJ family antitoxin